MLTNTRPRTPAETAADIVWAEFPKGPADAETRPEALLVGDLLRFNGEWHVVMGVQPGLLTTYLRLLEPGSGTWRTVFYRRGRWVIAAAGLREEAAA